MLLYFNYGIIKTLIIWHRQQKNRLAHSYAIESQYKFDFKCFTVVSKNINTRLFEAIIGVSNKMFTQTVGELEKDSLIPRKVYPVVSLKLEYTLSTPGESLESVL